MKREMRKIPGAPQASPIGEAGSLESYLPTEPQPPADLREIVLAGSVVLQIVETPTGPMLKIRAPRIAFEAYDTIELRANTLRLESIGQLEIVAGRILTEAAERSTTIAGADRLEAAEIEAQASSGALSLRAQAAISLDGEHIGLNDDPCPRPFVWSRRHQELGHGE